MNNSIYCEKNKGLGYKNGSGNINPNVNSKNSPNGSKIANGDFTVFIDGVAVLSNAKLKNEASYIVLMNCLQALADKHPELELNITDEQLKSEAGLRIPPYDLKLNTSVDNEHCWLSVTADFNPTRTIRDDLKKRGLYDHSKIGESYNISKSNYIHPYGYNGDLNWVLPSNCNQVKRELLALKKFAKQLGLNDANLKLAKLELNVSILDWYPDEAYNKLKQICRYLFGEPAKQYAEPENTTYQDFDLSSNKHLKVYKKVRANAHAPGLIRVEIVLYDLKINGADIASAVNAIVKDAVVELKSFARYFVECLKPHRTLPTRILNELLDHPELLKRPNAGYQLKKLESYFVELDCKSLNKRFAIKPDYIDFVLERVAVATQKEDLND